MNEKKHYVSYKHYMVCFSEESRTVDFICEKPRARASMRLDGLYLGEQRCVDFGEYTGAKVTRATGVRSHELTVRFAHENPSVPGAELFFRVGARGITFAVREIGHYEFRGKGYIDFGDPDNAYAVNLRDDTLSATRGAIGPASAVGDNAIYNRLDDTAFLIDRIKGLTLEYDFDESRYGFEIRTMTEGVAEYMRFEVRENILGERYDIEYSPLKKRGDYDKPPAGFMTWYAVRFGASEESVLRNLAFQRDELKKYGADTVWIDWEWCHRAYERERDDGVNNLSPDLKKYPRGLGFIAEEIKAAGLHPALWIGLTNDISMTDFERENPGVSLVHNETWSGMYYYDITTDEYLEGYLPRGLELVKKWGYDAVKFDTLPNCISAHESFHGNMRNPETTTYSAYRNMIERTREILGEDTLMLSCGGSAEVVLWGTGVFDSARVGPDLFAWDRFVKTMDNAAEFYPLHNNAIMVDPDNVVLRDEFSTERQARSRISAVALMGLPLTLGDDLPYLPEERVALIKKALPVMKIHPQSLGVCASDKITRLYSLRVAKPWESYTVFGLLNTTDRTVTREICLKRDLGLADGEYLGYDFFADKPVYPRAGSLILEVEPYDTAVIAIRRRLDRPQLLSTSRHITQGAAEIKDLTWGDNTLALTAELVGGDEYCATFFVPSGYTFESVSGAEYTLDGNILKVTLTPDECGEYTIRLDFSRN